MILSKKKLQRKVRTKTAAKVYELYCIPSGKRYIGYTKRSLKKRWGANGSNYLKKREDGKYHHPHLAAAILKYGWDNFEKRCLADRLSIEDALMLERFYIEIYNSIDRECGYNYSLGGDAGHRKYASDKDRRDAENERARQHKSLEFICPDCGTIEMLGAFKEWGNKKRCKICAKLYNEANKRIKAKAYYDKKKQEKAMSLIEDLRNQILNDLKSDVIIS